MSSSNGRFAAAQLTKEQIEALRVPGETLFLRLIWAFCGFVGVSLVALAADWLPSRRLAVALVAAIASAAGWLCWRLGCRAADRRSARVTEARHPAVHALVARASGALQMSPPATFVLPAQGLVARWGAKTYLRRGMLVLTAEMVDDLATSGDARRATMMIGRQLGHLAAGHFDGWFFKDVVGRLALVLHGAYRRQCHYTADRIGLVLAGDLVESQAALLALTAGRGLAPRTGFNALRERQAGRAESSLGWLLEVFGSRPAVTYRLMALEEFCHGKYGRDLARRYGTAVAIGTEPIDGDEAAAE
jgi:Zn-dependent protease with chaperone function